MAVASRSLKADFGDAPRARRSRRAGFTITELLVVVAMLAVLGSAAVPKFLTYIYRARRSEAMYGLRTIAEKQIDHYARNMQYSDSFHELGRPLSGGKIRDDGAYEARYYTFTLTTWDLAARPKANYRATATADLDPTDDTLDIVIIENQLTVFE